MNEWKNERKRGQKGGWTEGRNKEMMEVKDKERNRNNERQQEIKERKKSAYF